MGQASPSVSHKNLWSSVVTIPNLLSALRLLLGLVFPFVALSYRLPILILGAVTDLLDGMLSRVLRASTLAGRILDPVADKVFVAGITLTLLWREELTVWEVIGFACRDLVVVVGVFVLISSGRWRVFQRMAPTWLGKMTTAAQFGFLLVLFTVPEYKYWPLFLVVGLSCCAGGQYFWQFWAVQISKETDVKN
jgi:phosphatidylglycerophosphate synthase